MKSQIYNYSYFYTSLQMVAWNNSRDNQNSQIVEGKTTPQANKASTALNIEQNQTPKNTKSQL